MNKTVAGLFDNYDDAQAAVNDLLSDGFVSEDVGIAANNAGNRFTAGSGAASLSSADFNVATGVTGGAAEGAVIGGMTGLAAGLATLLLPGVGPVFAVGLLAAALPGAGLGAVGGGVIGGLTALGIPEEQAHYYAEGVRRGGTLVTVHAADGMRAEEAVAALNRHGAADIEQRSRLFAADGFNGYREDAPHWSLDEIEAERLRRTNNFATAATVRDPAELALAR